MNYQFRVSIVDCVSNNQYDQAKRDLLEFSRILNADLQPCELLPGDNVFFLDLHPLSERRIFFLIKAFEALECLNRNFCFELREM